MKVCSKSVVLVSPRLGLCSVVGLICANLASCGQVKDAQNLKRDALPDAVSELLKTAAAQVPEKYRSLFSRPEGIVLRRLADGRDPLWGTPLPLWVMRFLRGLEHHRAFLEASLDLRHFEDLYPVMWAAVGQIIRDGQVDLGKLRSAYRDWWNEWRVRGGFKRLPGKRR